jgi:hypothetical protein
MAGSYEYSDEPSGSGTKELVYLVNAQLFSPPHPPQPHYRALMIQIRYTDHSQQNCPRQNVFG